MSKRESTLSEVERNTRELRELLDQHKISGSSLELNEEAKVCAPPTGQLHILFKKINFNSKMVSDEFRQNKVKKIE